MKKVKNIKTKAVEVAEELLTLRQRRYQQLMAERGFESPGTGLALFEAHTEVVRILDMEHPDYKVDKR